MATTGTQTVLDIVKAALEDIEAIQMGQNVPAEQGQQALGHLNRLMKAWQLLDATPAFLKAPMTHNGQVGRQQTLTPVRPIRILSCRYNNGSNEIPMIRLSRDEYDELPNKLITGTPTQFYYDRQKEAAVLLVWPALLAPSGTFEITYEREFEDVTDLAQVIDLPGEWWDVAVKQLASRLLNPYGSEAAKARVPGEASAALNTALAAGVSGESVYFMQDEAYA